MKNLLLKAAAVTFAFATSALHCYAQNLFTPTSDADAGLSSKQLEKLANLRQNPVYKSIQMVQVGDIPTLETNGFLNVNIPNLPTYTASAFHISHPQNLDGDFKWEGAFYLTGNYNGKDTVEGDGNITLYRKDSEVFGFMRPPYSSDVYELVSFAPGKNAIIKYSSDALNAAGDCGNDTQEPDTPAQKVSSAPCGYIRVLILYTDAAANAVPNIYNTAQIAMADLDGATWNSTAGIDQPKFQLVGVTSLNGGFAEASKAKTTLDIFRNTAFVQAMRDAYAADLVVFLTDGNFHDENNPTYEIWGQSVPGPSVEAYSLVEADKCNTEYTFSHEIGHLLGAHHNLCDDQNTPQCDTPKAGLMHPKKISRPCFICSPGSTQYQTIMWELNGKSRSHLYSTPNYQIWGRDMGDNDYRNNTKIMSDNACSVAGYRADTAVYFTVSITGSSLAHTGQSVTLHATPHNGTLPYGLYVWKMETGLFTYTILASSTADVTFPMPAQAHAYVSVEVYDHYSRTATTEKTVTNFDYLTYMPITQTPGHLRTYKPGAEEDLTMTVYPNPATDIASVALQIPSKDGGCHSLIVSDLLGKVVYSNTITGNGLQNIDINTVKLAAGSYIIRVTGGKEPKIAKLTVTH